LSNTHDERLIISINDFIDGMREHVDEELETAVEIQDTATFPTLEQIYGIKRIWKRIDDVVAVVVDLKGSTRLGLGRHAETTARLYEATTGSMVRIVERFGPDFLDIQGDGLFALFHGHRRYERAMCAAITLKTFGQSQLEPSIKEHLGEDFPDTGLKVGMAAGRLIVKKVGVRGTNEPVWAGRSVNYAAKCAQTTSKQELIITPRVWKKFESNDYVRYSCGCGQSGLVSELWTVTVVDNLPEGANECRLLPILIGWCKDHGDQFCQAILDGKTKRDDVSEQAA
jgi:class 3 adenylate cyclase